MQNSLVLVALTLGLAATALRSQADERCALWRKDVTFLAEELPKRHPKLFHTLSEEAWKQQITALDAKLEKGCSLAEYVAGMAALVASVGDGHTSLAWHRAGFPWLPIRVYEFADGIHVLAYPRAQPRLRRARLVSIEGIAIDEALGRIEKLAAADTEPHRRNQRLQLAMVPALWGALGIGNGTKLRLGFVDLDGKGFEVQLAGVPPQMLRRVIDRYSFDKMSDAWKRREQSYWYRWFPERKVMWLWYRRCQDGPSFSKLVDKMWKSVEGLEVEGLIVDLRANGGGNSLVIAPLFSSFVKQKLRGKIFTIVGRSTFSSAMMNADQLQRTYKATTIGEEIGGKPGHFGEVKVLRLPESRLPVQYSTKDFGVDLRKEALRIDVPVALTSEDVFAGRDAFLEAAFAEVEKAAALRTRAKQERKKGSKFE